MLDTFLLLLAWVVAVTLTLILVAVCLAEGFYPTSGPWSFRRLFFTVGGAVLAWCWIIVEWISG